jgi:G6PDH family F420-dependent oxidoreductase
MLEEAVEVMRKLWGGEYVDHHGKHYTVENARIYTLPDGPPRIYVSGFGDRSIELAARIGDGFITTKPDAEAVGQFRGAAGDGKPVVAGMKSCWAPTTVEAVKIAHKYWATSGLPGELAQVLPSPRHFEQGAELVTEDMTARSYVCGPDAGPQLKSLTQYRDAGFDEVYVASIGPNYRDLIELYRTDILSTWDAG